MLKSTKADLISIHAPRAGCDYATPTESSLLQTISIHAPRAGCDLVIFSVNTPLGISIHAPRAGCDQRASLPDDRPEQFQSTHPVRGATTGDWESLLSINTFQSTHPVRGATTNPSLLNVDTRISIHAPRAGCDHLHPLSVYLNHHFNPRTPCGVRPPYRTTLCTACNFNPRTPCGVRLSVGNSVVCVPETFQSTHPVRGATKDVPICMKFAGKFQSTHPVRGATA